MFKSIFILFCGIIFFVFCLLKATPLAYGGSQGRGSNRSWGRRPKAIATATRNLSSLHHSSWQCQILNPLSEARDPTPNLMVPSWIRFRCATTGAPRAFLDSQPKWWVTFNRLWMQISQENTPVPRLKDKWQLETITKTHTACRNGEPAPVGSWPESIGTWLWIFRACFWWPVLPVKSVASLPTFPKLKKAQLTRVRRTTICWKPGLGLTTRSLSRISFFSPSFCLFWGCSRGIWRFLG